MASSSITIFYLLAILFVISSAINMSVVSHNQNKAPQERAARTEEEVMALYESWLIKHGKNYNGLGEKERRFGIFKDDLRYIDDHNSQNRSFKLGLNKFADLTNEEYRSTYLGTRRKSNSVSVGSKSNMYAYKEGDSIPESVDWREKGAVVAVKDQGSCAVIEIGPRASTPTSLSQQLSVFISKGKGQSIYFRGNMERET